MRDAQWIYNSWMMNRNYNLHNFCFCKTQDKNPYHQDISAPRMTEILIPQTDCCTHAMEEKSDEEAVCEPIIKLNKKDISQSQGKETFEKFLYEQIDAGYSVQFLSTMNLSKKEVKEIERGFTNSKSRKDVIYKAILRFFRRTCQMDIRQMKCSICRKENEVDLLCLHTDENSIDYLSSEFGIPVTPELVEIFRVIISFGSVASHADSPAYEFTSVFKPLMVKFNRKKLQKVLSNKYFAIIFLKFWQKAESFQKMVSCLNTKREEEVDEEAYTYYLQKLMHSCSETLQGSIP
ncbi:unnamed protein product [Moneuplotes crassus]|uniref:Uncharacterized protein n=1 Tax=Euplotes crassus TaxID=5936 RepID=A0AAD1UL93_EUPCR|nr:unnamed protein product [Moneuplotes crassus]